MNIAGIRFRACAGTARAVQKRPDKEEDRTEQGVATEVCQVRGALPGLCGERDTRDSGDAAAGSCRGDRGTYRSVDRNRLAHGPIAHRRALHSRAHAASSVERYAVIRTWLAVRHTVTGHAASSPVVPIRATARGGGLAAHRFDLVGAVC